MKNLIKYLLAACFIIPVFSWGMSIAVGSLDNLPGTLDVANGGTGGTGFASGAVIVSTRAGATDVLDDDGSQLFWDFDLNRLGVGTSLPATLLHVDGAAQFGSGDTKSTFTATGFWEPVSKTKAQIDTLVPTKTGQVIYASDTTLPGLCISTGTSAAQWRKMESATLGCGANN